MFDIFLPIPCCWPDKKEREIRRINSDIEKQIKRDKRESKKQYKILLLGGGESGKSTFIRDLRLQYKIKSLYKISKYLQNNLLTMI